MLEGVPSKISGVTTYQPEVFGDETGKWKALPVCPQV
jgi:hypothetical protein